MSVHAVGLDYNEPYKRHGKLYYRPHRNYYDAGKVDVAYWDILVSKGFANSGKRDTLGGCMYWLSDKGFDWLGKELGIRIHDTIISY